ncbi:MAG: hypothetical protein K0U38_01425 [Epsilonproteobacteria bacterium]|nr:hypothetical protein [Campylobacterota bacterium]
MKTPTLNPETENLRMEMGGILHRIFIGRLNVEMATTQANQVVSKVEQRAREEERKRIKSAFIKHFAGAGELFFPYRGVSDVTLDDEIAAAQDEWKQVLEELTPPTTNERKK